MVDFETDLLLQEPSSLRLSEDNSTRPLLHLPGSLTYVTTGLRIRVVVQGVVSSEDHWFTYSTGPDTYSRSEEGVRTITYKLPEYMVCRFTFTVSIVCPSRYTLGRVVPTGPVLVTSLWYNGRRYWFVEVRLWYSVPWSVGRPSSK